MIKNGITLLSKHDPVTQCRKAADAVTVKDKTLYFCPSPLYGYGLDLFLDKLNKQAPNSIVLCIEADNELYELAKKNIFTCGTASDKLRLVNFCEPEKLCAFVRKEWGARAFRRAESLRLTGGWQLFPKLYNSLLEALRSEIALDWSNALTLTKLGRLYIRNMLRNISLIPKWKSAGELSFGNSPVLVLGAGPSLDKALDDLPEKKDFKIVCVDTCLPALKDRGIVPDLVVILESQHWNLRDFTGCKDWNVSFAFDLSALPASAKVLAGQGYLFMTPWTNLCFFERLKTFGLLPNVVPPLGSVGLTAMEIAHRLTTGKITHAGFDFSFTLDKYHARGTPGHKNKLNTHNRFGGLLNDAVFGAGIFSAGDGKYSNPIMRKYKEMFEKMFLQEPLVRQKPNAEAQKIPGSNEDLNNFIKSEIDRLNELRDMLAGKKAMEKDRLHILIEECNYLWAHFPDYAGGVKPDNEDISFLNRVRVEIDLMMNLLSL